MFPKIGFLIDRERKVKGYLTRRAHDKKVGRGMILPQKKLLYMK